MGAIALAAIFTKLLNTDFSELLDAVFPAVFTDLSAVVFAQLLTAFFPELLVDDFAATALARDAPLLACFDLEEIFAAATLGGLSVDGLAL
jgi:hypothetical protein